MKKIAVIIFGGIVGLVLSIGTAEALPTFARKYGTSCQTCHTVYPNLTPFGKAFKNSGLRWPGEDRSADFQKKDEPVLLGAKAYEKLWPKAVWPGEIPGLPPLALMLTTNLNSAPRSGAANDKFPFQGFGSALELLAAGTLGRDFAFWGGGAFNLIVDPATGATTTEAELGRTYLIISPFEKPVFVAKVGRFDPHLTATNTSVHRSLLGTYYLTKDRMIQDNLFTLEESQQGVEISGYPGGRLGYAVGLVEGANNPLNNPKDVYGRVEYKIGGLRSDGMSDKDLASTDPWRDDSITIGGFGYLGFSKISNAAEVAAGTALAPAVFQDDRFWLTGVDLDINYANFLADLGYARQKNNQPLVGSGASVSTNHLFSEVSWVAYPWLIPGIKYELFDSTGTRSQRITVGSNFLLRANIKASLMGVFEKSNFAGATISGGFTSNPAIQVGLVAAF